MALCKNQAQADAEIDEWIATAAGKAFLGQWGAQCALFAQETAAALFGLEDGKTAIGWGNARDHIDNDSPACFDIIWNRPGDPSWLPRRGDLMIWNGLLLWGGYYGHVGVCTSFTQARVKVLQQDGAAAPNRVFPDGYRYSVKPVHYGEFAYMGDPGVGNVRGWLRPKWQKVVYTAADKRGYGPKPVAKKAPVKAVAKAATVKAKPKATPTPSARAAVIQKQLRAHLGTGDARIKQTQLRALIGTADALAAQLKEKK